jgi:hypothetical protein
LFGPAVLAPELSSPFAEDATAIRRDGLGFFLVSIHPNGRIGVIDIWVSTRDRTLDLWSTPVDLGPTANYPGYTAGRPPLSSDGTTLYVYSDRPGGFRGGLTSTSLHAASSRTTRRTKKNPVIDASPRAILITLAQNEA